MNFVLLILIKPLGLIVHRLCFLGVNVFAIDCICRMCGIEESSRLSGFADFAIEVFYIVQE